MKFKTYALSVAATGSLALAAVLGTALAQEGTSRTRNVRTPGIEQNVLIDEPLAQFPGKHVLAFTGTFDPGAKTPLHRHPGTEFLYVLEGSGAMVLPDREGSEELTPGRMVLVEPMAGESSFIHQAVNLSTTEGMKTLVILIHDEGTTPALPVDGDHE